MYHPMKVIIRICLVFVITSCQENNEGLILRGDLIGTIEIFNEFGELFDDHSGYEVTVEGTDPILKTVTDGGGQFIFRDLPTGTYNFVFQKEQFQTRKIFS